jgi:hypothetical protein
MGRAQAGETWPLNLSRVNDELDAAINDAAVRTVLRYAKRAGMAVDEIGDCCARLGLDLAVALERAALPCPGAVERLEPLQPYPSGPLAI